MNITRNVGALAIALGSLGVSLLSGCYSYVPARQVYYNSGYYARPAYYSGGVYYNQPAYYGRPAYAAPAYAAPAYARPAYAAPVYAAPRAGVYVRRW